MKGLLLKDFMLIKKSARMLLFFIVIFGASTVISKSIAYFSSILALLCVSCVNSTFNYDHSAGWSTYALAAPVSRRQFVLSKYVLVLIMVSISALLSLLIIWGSSLALSDVSFREFGIVCITSLGGVLLFSSLFIPLLLYFGTEKGRYAVIFCIAIMYGIIFAAAQVLTENSVPALFAVLPAKILLALFPLLSLLLFYLSYEISCAIVKKKEF